MDEQIVDRLASELPAIVPRFNIDRLTGGLLTPATMRNHDTRGTGPKPRVKVGGKVAYPVDALTAWLRSRLTILDAGGGNTADTPQV